MQSGCRGGQQQPWVRGQEQQGLPRGPSGQGLAARACPTAPARSRAAGRHRGSPSPGHQAPSWGWGQAGMLACGLAGMWWGCSLGRAHGGVQLKAAPGEWGQGWGGVGPGSGRLAVLSGSPAGRGCPPWPSISDPAQRLSSQTPKPEGCTHALTLNVAGDLTYIQVALSNTLKILWVYLFILFAHCSVQVQNRRDHCLVCPIH